MKIKRIGKSNSIAVEIQRFIFTKNEKKSGFNIAPV